jgi:hypothetical protein
MDRSNPKSRPTPKKANKKRTRTPTDRYSQGGLTELVDSDDDGPYVDGRLMEGASPERSTASKKHKKKKHKKKKHKKAQEVV